MFSHSGTHTPVLSSPMHSLHQSPTAAHPQPHSHSSLNPNTNSHPSHPHYHHHNRNYNPRHEPVDDTVTWIKDWYSPTTVSSQSRDDDPTPSLVDSIKLKGWVKTNLNHKLLGSTNSSNNYNPNDVLDLNQWKYYNGVPITDHSRKSSVIDRVLDNDDDEDDNDSNANNNDDEDDMDEGIDEEDARSYMEGENYNLVSAKELESAISFKSDEGHISGL